MKEDVKKFLTEYNKKNGWSSNNDNDLWETLEASGEVQHVELINERRWWNDVDIVVEIDGKLIAYNGAETTGDSSPRDVGWEPDYESARFIELVKEMVEVEKIKEIK